MNAVPAPHRDLADSLPGLLDHVLERLLSFGRVIRDQIGNSLKLHQHRLKALQQGVVQFPGDARSLTDTFFHAYLKLPCQLAHP